MGGEFERSERLEHQTLGVQRLAVRSEDYWDYKPEQRVQTIDGVVGVVKHVQDGPVPGTEEYHVELEHGLGGGRYTASQLSPAPITTAAMEQTAAVDYPELAQILVERPDPASLHVTAAQADDDEEDDDSDDADDSSDEEGDSDDSEGQDDADDGDDDSDGDDAPPWAKSASKVFSDLVVMAATDIDFRFHVTAAWRDVVEKAKRIRSEGRLRVTLASDGMVFGEVKGDHEVYETGLQRMPGKMAAHAWSCGCKWGAYHWGAPDDFSRFAGRMCSHALALQYEAQSRGMFGREVHVDEHKPHWVPRKVVVRYDIDADKHRLAPSTASVGHGPEVLYHGTSTNHLPHVEQHGLNSPYLARDPEDAEYYAREIAEERGGKPVVLRVHHPDPANLRYDGAAMSEPVNGKQPNYPDHHPQPHEWQISHDEAGSVRHEGTVPPHKIQVDRHEDDFESEEPSWGHYFGSAHTATAFAPLSVVARAAVAAGEDEQELMVALAAAGISPGQGELFDSSSYKVEKPKKQVSDREQYGDDENGHRYHVDGRGNRFYPCFNKHCPEGGKHEDGESARAHRDVFTDWNTVHPTLPDTLHRGMALSLPDDVHSVVHDDHRPAVERAQALSEHLRGEGLGTHWTPDHDQAKHYSGITDGRDKDTHVIMHVHTPSKRAIETDPDTLAEQDVISMGSHDDAEVPLRSGAKVQLKGLSWRHRTDEKWTRHDFDRPVKHTANRRQAVASGSPLVNPENVERNKSWESHGLGPWDHEDEDTGDDRNVHEWYHGAPHRIDEFRHEGEHAGEAHSAHWNNALGSHWAANEQLAGTFGPHVHHAELHVSNPKHYASEYDMDREVYGHEYEAGNTPDKHDPEHHQRWGGDPSLGHNDDLRHQPEEIEHEGRTVDNRPRFMRWLSTHPDRAGIATRFKERLQAQGHDGITYGNEIEKNSFDEAGKKNLCAIPFHPGQIKVTQSHPVTREDEYGVEEDHPCLPRSQRNHMRHTANANAPFGEPSGTSYHLPKTPGATQKRRPWENPASAGPLAGADPVGWNRQLPLQSYANAGMDTALFEPGGTEAVLHDEPEPALPSTDGSVPTDEASDLTPSMTAGLKRQALKDFSLAEQQALINEGEGVRAANLDRLDITGTHYADLEQVLAAQEDDTTWLI